ncbi:hypothetical protein NL676_003771 [Syzygium grande]|nr:hypothetical protein NL676_003771 [Syzygium grande]
MGPVTLDSSTLLRPGFIRHAGVPSVVSFRAKMAFNTILPQKPEGRCTFLFAATATSVSPVTVATEPVVAPAPAPTGTAAAILPVVSSLVGASLVSFLAYHLN